MYKHGKLVAVSAVMLLGLAACNNNNDEALDLRNNRMTTLNNNNGTGYWDNDTKRLRGQYGRSETSAVRNQRQNTGNGTTEIMQMPNGYLTVDPNSYSTGIPSSKFPHTEMNTQGRLILEQGQDGDLAKLLEELQRRTGMRVPAPNGGAAPAPTQRTAPAPEQGAAPAPTQRTAPAPNGGAAPAPAPAPAPNQRPLQAPNVTPNQGAAPAPTQETAPAPQEKTNVTPSGTEISAFESKVIDLTNEQRRKNGLPNLQPDTALSNVAQEKSNDMQAKKYFSHTSPTYGSPFDMMRDFGVTYQSAGENIAMGQPSAEEVVNAWMNSEGHRKNILSPNFTHIGVGHTSQGNYWTQMFIGK